MNKKNELAKIKIRYGRIFILPWIVGVILFFLIPLFKSILYSFTNVKLSNINNLDFCGLKHYKSILTEDPAYLDNVGKSLSSMIYKLPLIVVLSLIFAIILNQNFHGRFIARAIFFLPVIFGSSVVMDILGNSGVNNTTAMATALGQTDAYTSVNFMEILVRLGLPKDVTNILSGYITEIFNLMWSCGIQILLFLSGLQSIPDSMYEVSKIEGATMWEEFWFITFPMLGNITLLVLVYTFIDFFTALDNPVIDQAYNAIQTNSVYDQTSAMLWGYFLIAGLAAGVLLLVYNHALLKRWN